MFYLKIIVKKRDFFKVGCLNIELDWACSSLKTRKNSVSHAARMLFILEYLPCMSARRVSSIISYLPQLSRWWLRKLVCQLPLKMKICICCTLSFFQRMSVFGLIFLRRVCFVVLCVRVCREKLGFAHSVVKHVLNRIRKVTETCRVYYHRGWLYIVSSAFHSSLQMDGDGRHLGSGILCLSNPLHFFYLHDVSDSFLIVLSLDSWCAMRSGTFTHVPWGVPLMPS